MSFELRYYQRDAVNAIYDYIGRTATGNPCIEIATGGGKTPVLAELCRDHLRWGYRVCVVTHVKELVAQAYQTLGKMLGSTENIGIYSAGLDRRDTEQPIICAGIQSVFKRANEFSSCKGDLFQQKDLLPFMMLIVDEAHLIPANGDGMYRQFISELMEINPKLRIVGLTATPYRLGSGLIYKHPSNMANHDKLIFDECIYKTSIIDLVNKKYLCPVKSYGGKVKADLQKVAVARGDYVKHEMEKAFEDVLVPALADVIARCDRFVRKSILIFASGVKAGEEITTLLRKSGERAELITGETEKEERKRHLVEFKDQKIRYLVNVDVLTTGFDAPNVDCVVLLRATKSPGLFYQMVGRGFRLHPDKSYCLVLDYGGNIVEHGPVDKINPPQLKKKGSGEAPMKDCPQCGLYISASTVLCPECNFEFSRESIDLLLEASKAGAMSGEITKFEVKVISTSFYVHYKKGFENDLTYPRTMEVRYEVSVTERYSEYICFEHEGPAWQGAKRWWGDRCPLVSCPKNIEDAVALCNAGILPKTTTLVIKHVAGERYPNSIIGHEYEAPLKADEAANILSEVHAKDEALKVELVESAMAALPGGNWFGSDDIPF